MRPGQAMLESLLAAIFVSLLFFALFWFSRLLTVKIVLNHAAARAARARSVGLNDFVCAKAARAATISVAGKCLWAMDHAGGEVPTDTLVHLIPQYMMREDSSSAAGCLDFEYWHSLDVDPGRDTQVKMDFKVLDIPTSLEGRSKIEEHYHDYLMR